jgi:hypothetical protein
LRAASNLPAAPSELHSRKMSAVIQSKRCPNTVKSPFG